MRDPGPPLDPSDLSPEERAVVPEDTPFRRLLEDRRVRLALIVGLPVVVSTLAAPVRPRAPFRPDGCGATSGAGPASRWANGRCRIAATTSS